MRFCICTGVQTFLCLIEVRPRANLNLDCCDRVNLPRHLISPRIISRKLNTYRVRPPNGLCFCLRQADIIELAFFNQFRERFDDVFN